MNTWSMNGTSEFPLIQPMVGQKEFYNVFKSFIGTIKHAGMATIFPVIGKWGIGKSRIGFEVISEAIGIDKGWIISEDGETKNVRVLKENFEDGILPIFIRYSQMIHEDLTSDNWVAYGTYTALSYLAEEADNSMQGKVIEELQNSLLPFGFKKEKLKDILKLDKIHKDDLLLDAKILDTMVKEALEHLKKCGIEQLLIVCEEVETAGEIAKYGLEKDKENINKVDGEAIKVISSAIKHEDTRKKYPNVSFMLLCSPVIGYHIKGIGALERRIPICELKNNTFADIADFMSHLKADGKMNAYPEGLVEAAYTIAGGNFGWFNVIMAEVDYCIAGKKEIKTGEILEDLLNTSARFQNSLIDKAAFDYISCKEKYRPIIKNALLMQLPIVKSNYTEEQLEGMIQAKSSDGTILFKEFYVVKLKKDALGEYLHSVGYKWEQGNQFANAFGASFDLEVLLKNLKMYSLHVEEHEYIIGAEEETFLDQVRMLYPEEGVEEAAKFIFEYIEGKVEEDEINPTHIGPNFAYLYQLNKRYRVDRGEFSYLTDGEKNQRLEEHIEEMKKDKEGEVHRILTGAIRSLEINYNDTENFQLEGMPCMRTIVEESPWITVNPQNIVTVVWGKDEDKLYRGLQDRRLLDKGMHPIYVLSDTNMEETLEKVKRDFKEVGKCLIPLQISRIQKEILEVMSISKEMVDFRDSANQIGIVYREKIRKLNDFFIHGARNWFEEIDEKGYILRPIIYKTQWDYKQVGLLAKAFKTMLVNNATIEQLGSDPSIKLKDGEYQDLLSIMKNVDIGTIMEKKGFKSTGIFINGDGSDVDIPKAFVHFLSFIGSQRRTLKEFESKNFFSGFDKVKPKKILEQWIEFFIALKLIHKSEGFIERLNNNDLKERYEKVKHWFEKDYVEEKNELREIIEGPYLNALDLQNPTYREKLEEAKTYMEKISLDILSEFRESTLDGWADVLKNLDYFYRLVEYVYHEEGWNSFSTFSSNIIKDLKIDDEEKALWYRIRHIKLFHAYIKEIQVPASDMINKMIKEIKKINEYRGIGFPISPITNLLKRYSVELEYATNYKELTTSKYKTTVKESYTLAYNLQTAKYSKAIERLEQILNECGIEGLVTSEFRWSDDKGIMGEYKSILKNFKEIVDFFIDKVQEAKRWAGYFKDAPEDLKNITEVKNLNNYIETLEIFCEGGLLEEIDNKEQELEAKPLEFLSHYKETIVEMKQYKGLIEGEMNNVIGKAKEERNKLYDNDLISTLDSIRRAKGKAAVSFNLANYPKEDTYGTSKKDIEEKMDDLRQEGRSYFQGQKVTFEFFKNVVEKKGAIDWNECEEEKRELEAMKLIKTEVVVL
ncbi:hypothetical protein [Clostridium kluyveri]|uniref:hypothetical protein n=1 Tax=Clostridium kluyveri TaxID=1534 RepID=UPI00224737FD|nr:hypothetical protein [Clostridium kluyveri]UZQ52409.1 hypothetical protein OP486_09705 [Clostridium kluyveri]